MTVDDLARLICETQNVDGFKCTCPVPFEPDWCNGNRAKAQARAVVRALRDETRHMTLNRDGLEELFTQILGDAGEKVGTHGSPELDEDARKLEAMGQDPGMTLEELLEPATDAAPAVCVWTETSIDPLGYAWLNSSCGLVDCHERDVLMQPDPQKHCPSCGKPIKFTEAK